MTEASRIVTEDGDYITTEDGDKITTEGTVISSSTVVRRKSYNFWNKYKYYYELRPKAKARRKR